MPVHKFLHNRFRSGVEGGGARWVFFDNWEGTLIDGNNRFSCRKGGESVSSANVISACKGKLVRVIFVFLSRWWIERRVVVR